MTSIINFEERMKSTDRTSDVVLNSLNRLYEAKLNGVLDKDEFSKIIVLTGNMFANKIKQGKITNDEIDQVESYIIGLDKHYFSNAHDDLDKASKIFLEGDYVALESLNTRKLSAQPIFSEEEYNKGFTKLR